MLKVELHMLTVIVILTLGLRLVRPADGKQGSQCGSKAGSGKKVNVGGVMVNQYARLGRYVLSGNNLGLVPCPAVRVSERVFLTSYRCARGHKGFNPYFMKELGIATRRFNGTRIQPAGPQYIEAQTYTLKWRLPEIDQRGAKSESYQDVVYHVVKKNTAITSLDWLDRLCLGPEEDDINKIKMTPLKLVCGTRSDKPEPEEEHDVKVLQWPKSKINQTTSFQHRALFTGESCKDDRAEAIIVTKSSPVRLIAMAVRYSPIVGGIIHGVDMGTEMTSRLEAAMSQSVRKLVARQGYE